MIVSTEDGAPAQEPCRVGDLRRLWESGEPSRALRGALDAWDRISGTDEELRWLEERLRTAGLLAESCAVLARAIRQRNESREWEWFIRNVLSSGDPWWARELLREAGAATRSLQALAIEIELAIGDAAPLITHWQQVHRDAAALDAAIRWWVRSGRIDAAESLLLAGTPDLDLWRARLAVWRGIPAVARSLLATLPSSPDVRCLEAIVTVQEGRLDDAERVFRSLLDTDARADAWTWLATVRRKQRRYAEAAVAAETANTMSQSFNLVLWMERTLANDLANRGAHRVRTVAQLEHAAALYRLGLKPEQTVEALEALIDRFGGNHTADLTTCDDGRLRAYRVPPDAGQLGVSVQVVLGTRGIDAVRALYDELAPQTHGQPRFPLYRGEIELWMGNYAEAARIFRAILDRHPDVKWAWIGLGASAMLRGELAEAQRIWAEGLSITRTAGPTLYVYRGECHRRQGHREEARADLELAVRQKPQRLSAWINLALLGGQPELLARVERECVEVAPILMGELSGDAPARLEAVLAAMRGNRASARVTYHLWGRVWQFMARALDVPLPRDRSPHR